LGKFEIRGVGVSLALIAAAFTDELIIAEVVALANFFV
jgi:hypothetical protein